MRKWIALILAVIISAVAASVVFADSVEEIKAEQTRRLEISRKYEQWARSMNFDAILEDLDSEECGLGEDCAKEVREKATRWHDLIAECTVESDPFTGETSARLNTLNAFADGCQAYPYLSDYDVRLIAGFPYDDALHYDEIYFKYGDEVLWLDRDDFDIQFDILNEETWEYSVLSLSYFGDEPLDALSFREDGSIRHEDYTMTEEEVKAFSTIRELFELREAVIRCVNDWYGEMR